tara:strand:- start:675 stop:1568 length:894 start_codon:yes stop_codon:yes gene_type:complete
MDLVLLEEKNLADAWKQKEARRRKNRKKNKFSGRKSKWGTTNLDFGSIFLTLTTGLAKIVLVVACSYGVLSSYRFITQSPRFNVNEMNLVGQKRLSNEELNSWIGPIIGKNIFQLELDKISQRLVEHAWVQSASARRVFPQGISVELKERTPFAKVQLDQVYVMDNYGVLLGTEVGDANKLPTITGIKAQNFKLGSNVANEEIIRGLKMMHSLNQLAMFENNQIDNVHINSRSRITFSTHNRDTKIHVRPEIAQEGFKNLALALDAIEKKGQGLSYIDLSFKNKIVVKHRKEVKRES